MVGRFYVVAEIYLHILVGGVGSWQNVGSLSSSADFESVEACQGYLDTRGQDYIAFFEEMARGLWLDELDTEPEDLRIDVKSQCYEPSS